MWEIERGGVIRDWAEVPYVPSRREEKKDTQRQQGELFWDGAAVRYFTVLINI